MNSNTGIFPGNNNNGVMTNNNPIKYSDLVQPDNSIADLIKQLDQLSDAYMNTLSNIKSEAITVKAALSGVSGATEEGRKKIREASGDTEKLTSAARELAFAEGENARKLAELKQARKEANEINKLSVRINQSSEGSYNKLSAQYSLNKIFLNNMTVEEREATEEGRKLVEETKAIYEEMKRLQEATGKTSLNVGNYAEATKGLRTILRENTQELARMRMAGEEGTAAYNKLLKETGDMRDAMDDANQSIKNMASDTSKLDSVLSGASAAGGGFAVYTGAMELFGSSSEEVQEAQKKLQATIAITTGLQAVQNAVQKQSALMIGISTVQTYALAKAEAYKRLIQIQGIKATIGATVAQKIFNLVASANPYVLLAMALITVIGALAIFASGTGKAAKEQKKLNEAQAAYLDYMQAEAEEMTRVSNERVKQLERELSVAKARNAGTAETQKIEAEILKERTAAHNKLVGYYGTEIDAIEDNRKKLNKLREELLRLQQAKARGDKKVYVDLEMNGKLSKAKIDDAIDAIQGQIDNTGRKVQIGVELVEEGKDLEAERKIKAAERAKSAQDAAKTETDIIRKAEDARIALIKNTYERERTQRTAAANREIADIQYRLKTEANLTTKARQTLNDQIKTIRQQHAADMVDIANKQRADELDAMRRTEDLRIALMADGAEKQREQLRVSYERQIQDINTRLETEKGLTEQQTTELLNQQTILYQQYAADLGKLNDQITLDQLNAEAERLQMKLDTVREGSEEEINLRIQMLQQQRKIELAQNKQLAEDVRQSEADINAKYDALVLQETSNLSNQRAMMLFDQQQALEQSEFDLLYNSEERKTRFRLEAEKKRLKKILELNKTAGVKMTEQEVKTIENTIAKIDQEISKSKGDERGKDIYGLFGLNLDDDAKQAISESTQFALGQLQAILDAKVAAADAAVAAADKEVDSAQKALDFELQARANGYANDVVTKQKELDLARKQQEKAQKDKAKAVKQQQMLDTILQTSSLITASANIWSSLSVIPIVGPALAVAALALMWGSFAASKIKASQMTKQGGGSESYGDGTVELLAGGSHQSGNDVDLGRKPDGTRRRAEGGEFFAVFNKRNSRRYRRLIPDVVRSLNNGTFMDKYANAYSGADGFAINVSSDSPELTELGDNVRTIKEQNERRYYTDAQGNVIEVYKNLKRIYKVN